MKTVLNEILGPLALRLGSITAGVLGGYGVTHDHANMVGVGVTGVLLVAAELAIRNWIKKE